MRCQPVTNWFMKSGERPMKPKLWSARSLKCWRFFTSSSRERGTRNEVETGWPVVGDG